MTIHSLPEGYTAHLPPPKHILGEAKRIPPHQSKSGCEQIEKTCQTCGAVRVTILGGDVPPRAWRIKDDCEQRPFEPRCRAIGA